VNFDTDEQYRESVVAEVVEAESGWILRDTDGWSILCPNEECTTTPKAGERVLFYGKGVGFEVRGIVVNGRVYRYQTAAEADAADSAWRADRLKRLEKELEATRAERDARVAALPKVFRERVERFQRARPDWRRDHEPYELFCCEEAVKIANYARGLTFMNLNVHVDARTQEKWTLDRFYKDTELQKAVLGKTLEDHSGNTFGAACNLAQIFLDRPEFVVKQHGALCPLVGCEEYGCWAAVEGKNNGKEVQ